MPIAYVDCAVGAAGDMLLGAFVDAGLPVAALEAAVAALGLGDEIRLEVTEVHRGGLRASHLAVRVRDDAPARAVPDILALIDGATLPAGVRAQSRAAIERLVAVESRLHGVPLEDLHLHELAGGDTIVDVVGFNVAREALGIAGLTVSPINVGSGAVRIAHGTVGVPGPATAELLRGAPIHGSDTPGEAITPTAALLLTGPGCTFGPMPAMRVRAIGYGAGSRDTPSPNVVRCFLGESATSAATGWGTETVTVLETNIDDLNPQLFEHVLARLFAEGALDAYLVPLIAKRGRPGVMVGVIAPPERADALAAVLFAETPTLGVRRRNTERATLDRRIEERVTSLGSLRVKIATLPDGGERVAPEYADLARIAAERNMPLLEVVLQIARELGL
ncbi:MAG: nickel pincer cofactor biosynthesis protein LarC [Chloroflexota bacterium]|nr:nickel pincer cofactor biosynthesis protein LarC [Chloroflexota bacterium]